MKNIFIFISFIIPVLFSIPVIHGQNIDEDRDIEITAQGIIARVDRILEYPPGELEGTLRHIYPDGRSFSLQLRGSIGVENSLFLFSSRNRGEQLKVLYKLGGEDIWVYDLLELKLFNKMGIDRFDRILSTNFFFIDLSNAELQASYTANLDGEASVKGIDAHKLTLKPIFSGGRYGSLVVYVDKEDLIPLRIDYYDNDDVIFKFMTISKTGEKDGRIFPVRYDMLDIRRGTISILTFNTIDEGVEFDPKIFRQKNLGD